MPAQPAPAARDTTDRATNFTSGAAGTTAADKAAALRGLLKSADLSFIMEAHDGLSAKIVEEAGFRGIWASGLTMSAALGVRDNHGAPWRAEQGRGGQGWGRRCRQRRGGWLVR